jgi:GrpB-like predicted nucleotidyltransferase (UPF0157 family)
MKKNIRIIEVVEHNEEWGSRFQSEAAKIKPALGSQIVAVHHIGSTAVPNLRAKPIIDILLEAADVAALDAFNPQMRQIGYFPKGEYGIPGRRFYQKGLVNRTHHIHAFKAGSHGARRHLAFRDYLIAQPRIAKQYGELKTRCAQESNNDIDKYCLAKEGFVKQHEQKALEWVKKTSRG